MFHSNADIGYCEEYGVPLSTTHFRGYLKGIDLTGKTGSNAGVWWIKADKFKEVTAAVQAIARNKPNEPAFWGDQPAWNRYLQDTQLRAQPIPVAHLRFPAYLHRDIRLCRETTMLHFCGPEMSEAKKLEMMFGMFMQRFYGDAAHLMIDVLEI